MKNPIEFVGIFAMLGLMQIFGSELAPASSLLTSMARSSNLSLIKQSLEWKEVQYSVVNSVSWALFQEVHYFLSDPHFS